MPTRSGTRNNLLAGIFVIASAILAIVISVIVSGAQKRLIPSHHYIIQFPVIEGAPGIKRGSIVNFGGQEVGRVTSVEFAPTKDGAGAPTDIDVHVSVRSRITLYEDAWAFLERPLLGTTSTLNFASAGTPATPVLKEGQVLRGRIAPPSFLTQAGYGPDQIKQFQSMITQAAAVVERIDRVTARFESEVEPSISKARAIVEDVKSVSGDLREKFPVWASSVDQVIAKIDGAGTRLNAALDHADEAVRGGRRRRT